MGPPYQSYAEMYKSRFGGQPKPRFFGDLAIIVVAGLAQVAREPLDHATLVGLEQAAETVGHSQRDRVLRTLWAVDEELLLLINPAHVIRLVAAQGAEIERRLRHRSAL